MPAKTSRKAQFVVVWEFRVRSGKRRGFETVYGPDGDWAKLFRRGEGYIRTDLIRDLKMPGRYLTIDIWISRPAYTRFKKENEAEYGAIDQSCASLTVSEVKVGEFQRSAGQKRWRP